MNQTVSVGKEAQEHNLLSEKHLTMDETIIQAWAAARSSKDMNDSPQPGYGSGHKS
jgi:hypothetical protein